MTIIAGNTVNVQTAGAGKSSVKPQSSDNSEKGIKISEDQVNISVKKGVVPFLKGAGIGLVAGGIGAGAATAVALKMGGGLNEWGSLAVIFVAGIGAAGGAVIGGTSANVTGNKWKAGGVGAAIGAVAMGVYTKSIPFAVVGAVGGGLAGLAGAAVAKKE